jgi:hypothetical protein
VATRGRIDSRLDKVKENVKGMVDKGEAGPRDEERVTDARQQVVSSSAYLDRASEMIKAIRSKVGRDRIRRRLHRNAFVPR